MKKIYFLLAAAFIGADAVAQNVVQSEALTLSKTVMNPPATALEAPTVVNGVAAVGDTINNLYFDFTNLTSGFVYNSSSPSYDWEIVNSMPTNLVNLGYDATFNSTSGGNFAIVNSDGQGSGTTQECMLQLVNPVNLSGYSSVALVWQQYYRVYTGDEHYVEYSTDGGSNWVSIQVDGGPSANASANPELASVNLGAAAGQPNVLIRFRFVGAWGLWWAIDDVAIVEGASADAALNAVYHGDVFGGYEYSRIPLSQVQEVGITVISENVGSGDVVFGYLYEIQDDNGVVASGQFLPNSVTSGSLPGLAADESDTTYYATGFTPSATGEYTVVVSIASDPGFPPVDQNSANNTSGSSFLVTDDIYSHDETLTGLINGGTQADPAPEYLAGLIYEVVADATLSAIQTIFYTQAGFELTSSTAWYEVYELVPGSTTPISQLTPIVSDLYDLQPSDISTGSTLTPVDIEINEGLGVQLTAGNSYLVALGNADVGETLVLLTSAGDDDFAGLRYGPYGQGGAVNWYTGWTSTPAVRAKLSTTTVDVADNEEVSEFNVYPNPTVQDLTVELTSVDDADMTINIISSTGTLVASEQLTSMAGQKSRINFNVDNLASGIYTVQVQGLASTLTKRVVVK